MSLGTFVVQPAGRNLSLERSLKLEVVLWVLFLFVCGGKKVFFLNSMVSKGGLQPVVNFNRTE